MSINNEQIEKLELLLKEVSESFAKLTDEQRLEIMGLYCVYCGCDDPLCRCWDDD